MSEEDVPLFTVQVEMSDVGLVVDQFVKSVVFNRLLCQTHSVTVLDTDAALDGPNVLFHCSPAPNITINTAGPVQRSEAWAAGRDFTAESGSWFSLLPAIQQQSGDILVRVDIFATPSVVELPAAASSAPASGFLGKLWGSPSAPAPVKPPSEVCVETWGSAAYPSAHSVVLLQTRH